MNLKRLQYFVEILDAGSLTQVANFLHVAQPALSRRIAERWIAKFQSLQLRARSGFEKKLQGANHE